MKVRTYTEPPPLKRHLRYGQRGDDVRAVQTILLEEGFFQGTPLGNFRALTREAVRHFQGTHIDKDGNELEVDGVVGPATWWALHNPHGSAQENGIPTPADLPLPDGTRTSYDARLALVQWMYDLHASNVREIPDGSNYGDGVTPIVNACGFKYGIPWCMAQASHGYRETQGVAPLGAMHVGCSLFWNAALKKGMAHRKGTYKPIPGDIGIYNYKGGLRHDGTLAGAGHATTVVRCDYRSRKHNAIEGNAGNRCKHSIRAEAQKSFVGYVNLFGDGDMRGLRESFPQGVTPAPEFELTLGGSR